MAIRILQGDCRTILPTLEAESFDCVITDPPYGETNLEWDRWPEGWPSLVRRVLKPTGSMWVFGSLRMLLEHWGEFSDWKLSHEVVWEKHNGTGLFNDRFRRVHELAVHLYPSTSKWDSIFKSPQFTNDATARTVRRKGRPAQWIGATGETIYKSIVGGRRLMRSIIFARSEHGRAIHPTQKPLEIVSPLLAYACPRGGHVIDPFSGSASTGLAAKLYGCDATLIELNATYVDMGRARIRDDAPLFAETAE